MKKIFSILLLAVALFTFTQAQAQAQKEEVTTKTATKKKGYTIINKGEPIIIYKYVHRAHSPKEAEKYAPKYFFVAGSSNVLQALTKANLKKTFPDNHAFHDALDANFREDRELVNYDDFHKMYKVSWLYKGSLK